MQQATAGVMHVAVDGDVQGVASDGELGAVLDRLRLAPRELWVPSDDGPALCMMRHGSGTWPMHLLCEGDAGAVSKGADETSAAVQPVFGNGQLDDYPAHWCAGCGQGLEAVADFAAKSGCRLGYVMWRTAYGWAGIG